MKTKISTLSALTAAAIFSFQQPVWSASDPVSCSGCVGTSDIASKAVTSDKIADSAVGPNKLATNSVTASKISNSTVLRSLNSLRDDVLLQSGNGVSISTSGNAITISASPAGAPVINDGSITTQKLADGAVTKEKIANGSVLKSVNGLKDEISIRASDNSGISVTTSGNSIILSNSPSTTTNQPVVTLSADNISTAKIYNNSIVKIDGTINITTSTYTGLNQNNLQISGGTISGTGEEIVSLGSYTVATNTHFENIKLDGTNTIFINCSFSGNISTPFIASIYGGELRNVTQTQDRPIGLIMSSAIINSTIARIDGINKTKIENSTIGYNQDIYGLSSLIDSNIANSKIRLGSDAKIIGNELDYSLIEITDNISGPIIISGNSFSKQLKGSNSAIIITANSDAPRQLSITGNTFESQTDNGAAITIDGSPTGPFYNQMINIDGNSFLKGQSAISYSGNTPTVIKNNVMKATSIGVANNNDNLRVSGNEEFY